MAREENLEISNCPLCGSKHIYKLKVERTYVAKMRDPMYDLGERPEPGPEPVRVTRIFICPIKNKKFQALFVLYQTSSEDEEITQVTVEGVVEDET